MKVYFRAPPQFHHVVVFLLYLDHRAHSTEGPPPDLLPMCSSQLLPLPSLFEICSLLCSWHSKVSVV